MPMCRQNFQKFCLVPTESLKYCVKTFFLLDVFSNVPTSTEMYVKHDNFCKKVSYVPFTIDEKVCFLLNIFGVCRQVPIKHLCANRIFALGVSHPYT